MARRSYSAADFRAAVADPSVRSIADLCRRLGLVPRGGNYDSVRRYAAELGLDVSRLTIPPRSGSLDGIPWEQPDRVRAVAAAASSIADFLRCFGRDPRGANYPAVIRELEGLGVDVVRLRAWTGHDTRRVTRSVTVAELVTRNHVSSARLKAALLREGVKAHRCERCGLAEWLGRPIPLELDHVDGDRRNNRLENLRLLCPNCHALTDTYRGRNIGRYDGSPG
jgi:hypothetical protein